MTDRVAAEKILVDFALEARTPSEGTTIRNQRAAVKGFLDC
jgi:hypothetical protein